MSKPLGLTQQDYDELENPKPRGEGPVPLPPFTWQENLIAFIAFALLIWFTLFFYVAAQLCRIGNRK
jgi:hypothetical protein